MLFHTYYEPVSYTHLWSIYQRKSIKTASATRWWETTTSPIWSCRRKAAPLGGAGNPDYVYLDYVYFARLLEADKQYDEAVAQFDKALAMDLSLIHI